MIFSRNYQQRFTASLAILAVLLLFVAPMVSKNLAERHEKMTGMVMPHGILNGLAKMTMPVSGGEHHHQRTSADPMMMDHSKMQEEGFACGYCDLLVHVPLLVWQFIPFIWLTLTISRAPPPPHTVCPVLRRDYDFHSPRGPPALFSAISYSA